MPNEHDRPPFLHWLLFHLLPAGALLLLGVALLVGIVMLLRSEPEQRVPPRVLPVVEAIAVEPGRVSVEVHSQGTVEARTRTVLMAEVSGRIESVSPALYAGGFFAQGDVLATIESTDYESALAAAKARQLDAQLAYEQERATAEQAEEDWTAVGNEGEASDLALRKPQLARALANLEAATAAVELAQRDLERTRIRAPYDGRVQEKLVGVGQIANARATQIASIYSVDTAEIRLPLPLSDTRFVDLPEAYRNASEEGPKPVVTIATTYGGVRYEWQGVIDRSEGAVDPQTRMIYAVAKVQDPYGREPGSDRPPLKVGSFVTAVIEGQPLENAYQIPRSALRDGDTVYIVDGGSLSIRPVEVFQRTTEIAIITEGISPGELVCLTPLQYVVNGMEVQVREREGATAEAPPANARL